MTKRFIAIATLFFTCSAGAMLAETLNGTLSDKMCNKKHVNASAKDIACAQKCFKMGSPAVFIVGDTVYQIENQKAISQNVMGHKVQITGTVKGNMIHVDYIKR